MTRLFQENYPNTDIQNIGLDAGNPSAYASASQDLAQDVSPEQSNAFGLALMDLLKRYQGVEQQPFLKQQYEAEEQQYKRTAYTDPSLIGASPGQQSGARNAAVGALEPTISGAKRSNQTFQSQLNSFDSILNQARLLKQDYETATVKSRGDAQNLISAAIEIGSSALQGLVDQQPDLIKQAGYDPKTLTAFVGALKKKEVEEVRQFNVKEGITPTGLGGGNSGAYSFETVDDIRNLPVSELTKSIIAGYGKLKDLTPTDKAKVQEELFKVGYNPSQSINRKIQKLAELWNKVPSQFKGIAQGRLQPFASSRDPDVANFESAKEILTREIARLNDVGVLSDQDVASYKRAMPSRGDANFSVVEGKLSGIGVATGGGLVQNKGNTVNIGGKSVPVGSIITNSKGQKARVNADGTVTPL